MTNLEQYKDDLTSRIWDKYCEIVTDIYYSSILVGKKNSAQNNLYFWGVYICLAIPAILNVIIKFEFVTDKYILSLLSLLIIMLPICLKYKNKQLIYSVFGLHEQSMNDLLELNGKLEQYKDNLLNLYSKSCCVALQRDKLDLLEKEFETLNLNYYSSIKMHDKLTGEIDEKIQAEAQEKAKLHITGTSFWKESDK